jgi:hypothetical protein
LICFSCKKVKFLPFYSKVESEVMDIDNGHRPNFPFLLSPSGFDRAKSYDSGSGTASLMISTSVAEPNPGSGAFLTLDPEGKKPDPGWEKNPDPGSYFRDLRNNF